MSSFFGIWIDHARAHIVELDGQGNVHGETLESGVESRHRALGQSGVAPPGHLGGNLESHYENRRSEELKRFFRQVIERVAGGAQVLVMGPGEAKYELEHALQRRPDVLSRVIGFEAVDKLSYDEIAQRARGALHEAMA